MNTWKRRLMLLAAFLAVLDSGLVLALWVVPRASAAYPADNFAASRAAVIAEIKDSPVEILYVLDARGRFLARSVGDSDSVSNPRQAADNYTIHNHPGQRHCRLSESDIKNALAGHKWATEVVCADGTTDIWTILEVRP